jgi:hypothetical protein
MANEKNMDIQSANETLKAIETDLRKAQDMAEFFFNKAATSTGEAAKNLDKMGGIWESLSKNTGEYLKLQKELKVQEADRLKLLEEMEKLKKDDTKEAKDLLELKKKEFDEANKGIQKQREAIGNTEKQIQAQKKVVSEIDNSTGALGKFFESGKAKLAAYLLSTERLMQAVKGFSQAARDVTDIAIQSGSFLGMTGNIGQDLITTGKAAFEYGTQLSLAETKLGLLGIKSEEVRDSFKEFSKITPFKDQAAQLEVLTSAIGAVSKELGVTLGDATEYVTESTMKYNRTAAQSAQTLYDVKTAVQTTNQELGRTVIVGRDVTKMLFDLARESTAGAQDQDLLAKTITSNMVNLQAQGNTLTQATRGVQTYTEAMTTKAPDWARYLAGPELVKQTKHLSKEMAAELEASQPGIVKRINDIQSSALAPFEKQQQIQKMLEGTRLGMQVMGEQVDKFLFDSQGKQKAGAALVIQGLYGITDPLLQQQFIDQRKNEVEVNKRMKDTAAIQKKYGTETADYLLAHQADLHDKILDDITEENKQKLKAIDDAKKAAEEANKKDLQDQINKAKDPALKAILQKKLEGLTGAGLAKTGEKALKEQTGSGLVANPGQAIFNFLQSPTGALLTGLLGIGSLLANSLIQTTFLAKIAASSPGGEAGGGALKTVGNLASKGAKGLVAGTSAAGLATAAGIGAAGGAVLLGGLSVAMRQTEIAQQKKAEATHQMVIDHIQERIKELQKSAGNEEKIAKLQKVIDDSESSHADQMAELHTSAWDKLKILTGIGTPTTGIMATPVAPVATPPTEAPPGAPGAGGGAAATGGGGTPSTQQTGQIVQTPRGYDYKITTTHTIPLSDIHGANAAVAARGSGGS